MGMILFHTGYGLVPRDSYLVEAVMMSLAMAFELAIFTKDLIFENSSSHSLLSKLEEATSN